MSKQAIKVLCLKTKAGVEQIEEKDQVSRLTKITGFDAEKTKALWKQAKDGKDEPEIGEEVAILEKNKITKAFKALQNILVFDAQEKERTNTVQKALDDKKAAEGVKLMLAAAKGEQIAIAYQDSGVKGIQAVVGNDFVASATGLVPKDGAVLTKTGMVTSLSGLLNSSDRLDLVKTSIGWNTGDLCLLIESSCGNKEEAEEIVAHATSVAGKKKHTVQQAWRVSGYFKPEQRSAGLTMTHHQEVFNYREPMEKAGVSVEEAIAYALDGVKSPEVDIKGKTTIHVAARSCAELRKWLQEKCGIKKTEKPEKAEKTQSTETIVEKEATAPKEPEFSFFFLDSATGSAYKWHAATPEALASETLYVYDLKSMKEVMADGSEGADIEELPEEFRSPVEAAATEAATEEAEAGDDIPG